MVGEHKTIRERMEEVAAFQEAIALRDVPLAVGISCEVREVVALAGRIASIACKPDFMVIPGLNTELGLIALAVVGRLAADAIEESGGDDTMRFVLKRLNAPDAAASYARLCQLAAEYQKQSEADARRAAGRPPQVLRTEEPDEEDEEDTVAQEYELPTKKITIIELLDKVHQLQESFEKFSGDIGGNLLTHYRKVDDALLEVQANLRKVQEEWASFHMRNPLATNDAGTSVEQPGGFSTEESAVLSSAVRELASVELKVGEFANTLNALNQRPGEVLGQHKFMVDNRPFISPNPIVTGQYVLAQAGLLGAAVDLFVMGDGRNVKVWPLNNSVDLRRHQQFYTERQDNPAS